MIIDKTGSFCCNCQKIHPASIVKINNEIFFIVDCPEGKKTIKISSNAKIFQRIRSKCLTDLTSNYKKLDISWGNQIEISDVCNLSCPICFTGSNEKNKKLLTPEEILKRVKILKSKGRRLLSLSGGEPTIHPDLFTIIKKINKQGMIVKILTNGIVIGSDIEYAKKLKKSSVEYCYFQFDSFNKKTLIKLRGKNTLDVKIKALDNAKKAGLKMGLVTVVVNENLKELGKILDFSKRYIPNLGIIVFLQAAKSAGRFKISKKDQVDREKIIDAIIDSKAVEGLTENNIWPFPRFTPMGFDIHPDCASLFFLAVNDGKIEPLENFVDIDKMYLLLGKTESKINLLYAFFIFIIYVLRCLKYKKIILIIKMLFGLFFKKGKHSILIVSIEQFMNEIYFDQKRIDHCTTYNILENGADVPVCIYNHPNPKIHPLNRKNLKNKKN